MVDLYPNTGFPGRTWAVQLTLSTLDEPDQYAGFLPTFLVLERGTPRLVSEVLDDHAAMSHYTNMSTGETATGTLRGDVRRAMNWLISTLLYVTMPGTPLEETYDSDEARRLIEQMQKHPKGGHKRERLKEKLRALNPQRVIYVDKHAKLFTPSQEGGQARPLTVRVKVAGHWKNQPFGIGRSQRKLIFIEPYWRGPEDVPATHPTHIVT